MSITRAVEFSGSRLALVLVWAAIGALAVSTALLAGAVRVTVPIANSRIEPELGNAFLAALPRSLVAEPGDDRDVYFQGLSTLTENGRPLGPGVQLHQAIRERGGGLFAVNLSALRFSTSDNSDPRRNGRAYRLTMPLTPSRALLLALFAGTVLIVLRAAAYLTHPPERSASDFKAERIRAAIAFTCGAALIVLLLIAGFGSFSVGLTSPAAWRLAVFCGVALAMIPFVRAPRRQLDTATRRDAAGTSMKTG